MDRFVVGTGRCGSTLLSRMLAKHPDLFSVFEFFNGLDGTRRFAPDPTSGNEFWDIISQPNPFIAMTTSRGYPVEEITYPFAEGSRFRPEDDIPWLLVTTLGRLDPDPDALLDRTEEFCRSRPQQTLTRHYRELFTWLAGQGGKSIWNERSGSSIDYLEGLARTFPGARFVHIHRAGEEAALSMREHHAFRLAISLVYNLYPEVDIGTAIANRHHVGDGPDPVRKILDNRPSAEFFGRFWSDQLARGYRQLQTIDADQYMEVVFEELINEPQATMGRIAEFFELPGDGWINEAAALVRSAPPARLDALPPDERERLIQSCYVGNQLLGRK
jgi:hypothetical protein